jgi:hypothetical protein
VGRGTGPTPVAPLSEAASMIFSQESIRVSTWYDFSLMRMFAWTGGAACK